MTLLLDVAPYYPPHAGGVEGFAAELHARLLDDGVVDRIHVLTSRLPAAAATEERTTSGVLVHRLPATEPVHNFPVPALWRRDVRREVRRGVALQPDVVVTHTRFFAPSLLGWWIARRAGARWIHVEHGSDFVQSGGLVGMVARAWDSLLGRTILKRCDELVAISDAVAQFAERLGGRQAEVIRRGMDPLAERTGRNDPTRVVFVGRLIAGKAVDDLLRALALLSDVPWNAVIVGDGDQATQLRRLARELGIDHRLSFEGECSHERALEHLRGADVFVNSSLTEGLPTGVLEAAGTGLAVVATDVGGTREILIDGRCGVLVPPREPAAIAEALRPLLVDGEARAAMGNAARVLVQQRFSWSESTDAWRRLIRRGS